MSDDAAIKVLTAHKDYSTRRGGTDDENYPVKRERKEMKKKIFCVALGALLVALCVSAQAQQPTKIPRIGYLSRDLHLADTRAPAPRNLEAFRQGLRQLGYVEGRNILI